MINAERMPKLGFGLMRLPMEAGRIDQEAVNRMVDTYMDAGMNYFDTAYVYHEGTSEKAAAKALADRYPRDAYYLATKLPVWEMRKANDKDVIFDRQLERLETDYVDFYLLHSVEEGNYAQYEEFGCFAWGDKLKMDGKVRNFGFSFHGGPDLLRRVLKEHPAIDFVQIQLNYADWDSPVVHSQRLYDILRERDVPIIVMEPVKGGILANLQPDIADILTQVRPEWNIASWALRFAATLPGVMTVLSGMSNGEQMIENIRTFQSLEPLAGDEKDAIARVVKAMHDLPTIACTSCRYCTPGCPSRIPIPDIFSALNGHRLHPDDTRPSFFYKGHTKEGGKASSCVQCGQCEAVCPQHLPIIDLLREAADVFDKAN